MPEGDTIHRTARTLHRALAHQPIRSVHATVAAVREAKLVGRAVERTEARGKNLLVFFDDGRILYSHMKMTGSWHVYRDHDRWAKPPRWAKVVLHTDAVIAVCFNAPVIEVLTPFALRGHPILSTLGPDLLAEAHDWPQIAERLARHLDAPVGEALLNQRIACGIGNVYKSETLFLCQQNPFIRLGDIEAASIEVIYSQARRLMQQNMGSGLRDTRRRDGGRYWVYGRAKDACRKCGTPIQMRRQGRHGRSTYFCPACQRVP